jgi:hypothetical protein
MMSIIYFTVIVGAPDMCRTRGLESQFPCYHYILVLNFSNHVQFWVLLEILLFSNFVSVITRHWWRLRWLGSRILPQIFYKTQVLWMLLTELIFLHLHIPWAIAISGSWEGRYSGYLSLLLFLWHNIIYTLGDIAGLLQDDSISSLKCNHFKVR